MSEDSVIFVSLCSAFGFPLQQCVELSQQYELFSLGAKSAGGACDSVADAYMSFSRACSTGDDVRDLIFSCVHATLQEYLLRFHEAAQSPCQFDLQRLQQSVSTFLAVLSVAEPSHRLVGKYGSLYAVNGDQLSEVRLAEQ